VITHVSGTVMYVADQDASRAFYVDRLGFRVVRDEEIGPGDRWLEVVPPGGQTSIVLAAAADFGRQPGEGAELAFACEDIHATVRQLREAGVKITDPLEVPWGRTGASIKAAKTTDPDGNDIVIAERVS